MIIKRTLLSRYDIIDSLSETERKKLLERVEANPLKLTPFQKDTLDSVLADFEATKLYEDEFLEDLREGLKKSSAYSR